MKAKWLNRFNEETQQNEQFYPITHKNAVVGIEDYILAEEDSEVSGNAPEIDPVVNNRINEVITYIDEKLAQAGLGSGGGGTVVSSKLEMYTLHVIATADGQTTFGISLSSFDASKDYVLVQSERLMLSPDLDFTIDGKNIILTEGVENGRNITIYIFKSGATENEEGGDSESVSGGSGNVSSGVSSKLVSYQYTLEATTEGQIEFTIPLNTFDASDDTLIVIDGQSVLLPNVGYTVSGNTITMTEPWSLGDGGGIIILKTITESGVGDNTGGTTNIGSLPDGSIPLSKLAEDVLPLDGSKSMTGNALKLANGMVKIEQGSIGANLIAFDEPNGVSQRWLGVRKPSSKSDKDGLALYTYDGTNISEYAIYGEHNKDLIAQSFLPLTGGTLSNAVHIKAPHQDILMLKNMAYNNREMWLKVWEDSISLYNLTDGNNYSSIFLDKSDTNLADLFKMGNTISGVSKEYRIFGEHNKPSGTYTGSGSATQRTINVGVGIGKLLHIFSRSGGVEILVGYNGAMYWNYSSAQFVAVPQSQMSYNFNTGILTIATATTFINGSSYEYEYRLL